MHLICLNLFLFALKTVPSLVVTPQNSFYSGFYFWNIRRAYYRYFGYVFSYFSGFCSGIEPIPLHMSELILLC